jgi:hypothetical protein
MSDALENLIDAFVVLSLFSLIALPCTGELT